MKKNYSAKEIWDICGYLAFSISDYDNDAFIKNFNFKAFIDILEIFDGIITTRTIWDYIPNNRKIVLDLVEISSCEYAYPKHRISNDTNIRGKKILVGNILDMPYSEEKFKSQRWLLDEPLVEKKLQLHPIDIPTLKFKHNEVMNLIAKINSVYDMKIKKTDDKEIKILERQESGLFYEIQAKMLYFAEQLPSLGAFQGVGLFNKIKDSHPGTLRYLLHWYFTTPVYRAFPNKIETNDVNPFALKTIGDVEKYFKKL